MDEAEARAALTTVGLAPAKVTPVLGGWANFTFDLDGEFMVRFPRSEGVAESTQRELRLLPSLGAAVDFAIPQPVEVGEWQGWPFFTYRKISGRPLQRGDDSPRLRSRLAEILGQLHSFPVATAAELLGISDPINAWGRHYEELWPLVETVALPELPHLAARQVVRGYEEFLSSDMDFPRCLVHNDLFSDHVLLDDVVGEITGIIDFEDASVGDPIIDFLPLSNELGVDSLGELAAGRELGSQAPLRFWFYRWMSGIHHIVYGATEGADPERLSGIAEVTSRILEPRLPEAFFRAPSA